MTADPWADPWAEEPPQTTVPDAAPMLTREQALAHQQTLDALAEAAAIRANAWRAELDRQMRQEHATQGAVATWRIGASQIIGQAVKESMVVSDSDAFTAWVAEQHPSEIETVVRPAFQRKLLDSLQAVDGQAMNWAGEIVPGVTMRPGGAYKGISIRPDRDARARAVEAAHQVLAQLDVPALPAPARYEIDPDDNPREEPT